jgi:hypothetical protein
MTDQTTPLVHVIAEMIRPRPGHRLLFTFGPLMDEAAMRERCPDPRFISTARSMSRKLIFTIDGASIVPRRDYVVHGVIWEVSEIALTGLDIQMGMPGIRDRLGAFARAPDGRLIVSEFYAARNNRPGTPDAAEVLTVIELAKRFRFPDAYVAELNQWLGGAIY